MRLAGTVCDDGGDVDIITDIVQVVIVPVTPVKADKRQRFVMIIISGEPWIPVCPDGHGLYFL